jgi:hypothetical protein
MNALKILAGSSDPKACLEAATTLGHQAQITEFDSRYCDWSTALPYVDFRPAQGGKKAPELSLFLGKSGVQGLIAVEDALERNQNSPLGDISEIFDAWKKAAQENSPARRSVLQMVQGLQQTLTMFLPLLGPEEEIPEKRGSGCIVTSPEWQKMLAWAKQNISTWNGRAPQEQLLIELAENASYGGTPGLTFKLSGLEVAEWIEVGSLQPVLAQKAQAQDKHNPLGSLAVYDFLNGSGHDIEGLLPNWENLQWPSEPRLGIINNFIDAVFWMTGNSPVTIPGKGTRCEDILWF